MEENLASGRCLKKVIMLADILVVMGILIVLEGENSMEFFPVITNEVGVKLQARSSIRRRRCDLGFNLTF